MSLRRATWCCAGFAGIRAGTGAAGAGAGRQADGAGRRAAAADAAAGRAAACRGQPHAGSRTEDCPAARGEGDICTRPASGVPYRLRGGVSVTRVDCQPQVLHTSVGMHALKVWV